MTEFLVVRWWVLAAVLLFGALMAGAAMGLMSARRPEWSQARRVVGASLVAPLMIVLGTLAGILLTAFNSSTDGWGDLARAALLQVGAWGAVLAVLGGSPAAALVARMVEE